MVISFSPFHIVITTSDEVGAWYSCNNFSFHISSADCFDSAFRYDVDFKKHDV